MKLIKDHAHFIAALARLNRHNEALQFPNCDNTFKIMIRPSSDDITEDESSMYFDVVIVYDESEDLHGKFARLLESEYCGYMDEGDFLIETLQVPKGDVLDADSIQEAIDTIENIYRMKICACFRYFLKDTDFDVCYFCQMTLPPQHEERPVCVICQDTMYPGTIATLPCCKQEVHRRCLELWLMTRATRTCPLCRSDDQV